MTDPLKRGFYIATIAHCMECHSRRARSVKGPMARQFYFSKMTPDDLNALVAWLRTIPPLE